MRVLVVNKFHWLKGGSERVYFDLARAYEKRGHDVIPFSMRGERNVPSAWEHHFVSEMRYDAPGALGALRGAVNAVYSREAKRRLAALVRRARPDVAHLHNFHHQLSPSIVDALREAGIPAVHTLHDYQVVCPNYLLYTQGSVCERCLGGAFHHAVWYRCVRGSIAASAVAALEMTVHRARHTLKRGISRFVAPSRFLAGKLVQAGIPRDRVRVIANGVDVSGFEPARGAGEGFLYVGRLSPEKGVETLLAAIERSADLRLTVLGEGPQQQVLQARAAARAPGRVTFLGHRSREELLERMRGARAVVLPSEWYENAPMSALESLASAVPVVAARIGGLPEIVRDGRTGLLFEPGDAIALKERLERLAHDPALATELGRGGRRVVEEEYTLEGQAESMLELLEEVASSTSR